MNIMKRKRTDLEVNKLKRAYTQFSKLHFTKGENVDFSDVDVDLKNGEFDWGSRVDEDKMMAHILNCMVTLSVVQQDRIARSHPLKLTDGGSALDEVTLKARNNIFRGALSTITKTMQYSTSEPPPVLDGVMDGLLLELFAG